MWAHPATLASFGLIIGFVGSLVGVGGGFLMVPYFTLVLRWPPLTAVGTSLSVIVANAASGVIGFARQKRIDYRVGTALGLSTLPGTILGRLAGQHLTSGAFKIIFGAVILVAAYVLVAVRAVARPGSNWFRRGAPRRLQDSTGQTYEYSVNLGFACALSVVLGFLSTLFGVGGGFIHVPLLILLFGVPEHVSMATSQYILVMTAAVGAVEYAAQNVELTALFWMGLGAFLGAQIGAHVSSKLGGRALRMILAAVLIAVSGLMIWSGLRRGA